MKRTFKHKNEYGINGPDSYVEIDEKGVCIIFDRIGAKGYSRDYWSLSDAEQLIKAGLWIEFTLSVQSIRAERVKSIQEEKERLYQQITALDEEIKQIQENERVESEFYVPLKRGVMKYDAWPTSIAKLMLEDCGQDGREFDGANQFLGLPFFVKGAKVVLIKINSGEMRWFYDDGEYFRIEQRLLGISESDAETLIEESWS